MVHHDWKDVRGPEDGGHREAIHSEDNSPVHPLRRPVSEANHLRAVPCPARAPESCSLGGGGGGGAGRQRLAGKPDALEGHHGAHTDGYFDHQTSVLPSETPGWRTLNGDFSSDPSVSPSVCGGPLTV